MFLSKKVTTFGCRRHLYWAFLLLAVMFVQSPAHSHARTENASKDRVNYYLDLYEEVDPQSAPRIERTHQIFKRVASAADRLDTYTPRLKIIKGLERPWARALSDGHVILSDRAIGISYADEDREIGDARLAFVAGHELAHLANGDFDSAESGKAHSDREIAADKRGFMYASMAGYRVGLLVGGQNNAKDFFRNWIDNRSVKKHRETDKNFDPGYPPIEKRAESLRKELHTLAEQLSFYEYGVRLTHFNRYEDALYFFETFQEVFPSREVFNNIGYCHLRLAIKQMPASHAFKYWLPTILDLRSQAENVTIQRDVIHKPGEQGKNTAWEEQLNQAVAFFKKATDKDKSYWPAWLNLAAAQFYFGEIFEARAAIEKALRIDPKNDRILTMRALTISREDPAADRWSSAVKALERLVSEDNALCAQYNLAVLLDDRGRSGNAKQIWKRLSSKLMQLPFPLREKVALNSDDPLPLLEELENMAGADRVKQWPWKIPMALGTDLSEDKAASKKLDAWPQIPFDWGSYKLQGRILSRADGVGILEMNSYVEMVVLRGHNLGTLEKLKQRLRSSSASNETISGRLYDYGDSCTVRVDGNRIVEVWLVRQPKGT